MLQKSHQQQIQNLSIEALKPLGEASAEAVLLLSYCQGEFNYDGVLERKEINRDKLEKDLMKLLLLVKKLEFQVQELVSKK